jgi:hypothetical protein
MSESRFFCESGIFLHSSDHAVASSQDHPSVASRAPTEVGCLAGTFGLDEHSRFNSRDAGPAQRGSL